MNKPSGPVQVGIQKTQTTTRDRSHKLVVEFAATDSLSSLVAAGNVLVHPGILFCFFPLPIDPLASFNDDHNTEHRWQFLETESPLVSGFEKLPRAREVGAASLNYQLAVFDSKMIYNFSLFLGQHAVIDPATGKLARIGLQQVSIPDRVLGKSDTLLPGRVTLYVYTVRCDGVEMLFDNADIPALHVKRLANFEERMFGSTFLAGDSNPYGVSNVNPLPFIGAKNPLLSPHDGLSQRPDSLEGLFRPAAGAVGGFLDVDRDGTEQETGEGEPAADDVSGLEA